MFGFDAICQNKVEGVVETVSGFIYTLREATWVKSWDKRSAKTIIVNIHINIISTYYNYFICTKD